MAAKRKLRTPTGATLLLLAVGGVSLALAVGFMAPRDSYLLTNLKRGLGDVPDEDVRARLEQIAGLGDRGVPLLVQSLHSDRRDVSEIAAELLNRYLDEQLHLSIKDSSPRVATLAKELAHQNQDCGTYASDSCIKLATRLLLWPVDRDVADGERLVADCEATIRACAPSDKPKPATEPQVVQAQYRDMTSPGIVSDNVITNLPGSGLKVEVAELDQDMRADGGFAAEGRVEPQTFFPVANRNGTGDVASAPQPISVESQPRIVRPDRSSEVRPEGDGASDDSDLAMMRKLRSSDPLQAQRAINELARRGFRTIHFRLAERLVDPDPAVRRELVEGLPQLTGIDSRPWLVWLSADSDAAVRTAAITIIATSNDPALLQHLREAEKTETDVDVLRLIRSAISRR